MAAKGSSHRRPGCGRGGAAMHSQIRGDERAHQPGPDRALVIGAVAAPRAAFVAAAVAADRCGESVRRPRGEQLALDHRDARAALSSRGSMRVRQADREDLVRADRGVARVAVDHIVEAAGRLVPEQLVEAARGASRRARA